MIQIVFVFYFERGYYNRHEFSNNRCYCRLLWMFRHVWFYFRLFGGNTAGWILVIL